jgi:hypothetical protein
MSLLVEFKDGGFEMPAMLKNLVPPQRYDYAGDGMFISPDGKHKMTFTEVKPGLTFIQCDLNIELPGVGIFSWKSFNFQKLEKNPIDAETAAVWKKRHGKKYMLADDLYTSGLFVNLTTPQTQIELNVDTDYGYVNGAKIVDDNFAKNVLYARDVVDFDFYMYNGAEYLIARNQHHIDIDAIGGLEADTDSVTIDENGFTKFFIIDKDTAGKTLSVKLPDTGVFAAYGEKFEGAEEAPRTLKSLTTVTGNEPVELADGDMLAFNGSAGDVFLLNFINK